MPSATFALDASAPATSARDPDASQSHPQRFALAPAASLAWRQWEGETVVHHALSNDTHRLAESAGTLLRTLEAHGPQDIDALASASGAGRDAVEEVLWALVDLNLVVAF